MAAQTHTIVSDPALEYAAPNKDKKQAAQFLGLTVEGLNTLLKQHRGPASFKIGRCVRFSAADLVAFAESRRRPAA